MKILMIYECIFKYGGGSQSAVFLWVNNLLELGNEVKILTGSDISTLEVPFNKDVFIVNKSINLGKIYQGLYLSTYLTRSAIREIKDFAPDIVHIHENSYLNGSVFHLLRKTNAKFVGTFHTNVMKSRVSNFFLIKILETTRVFNMILEVALIRDLKKCMVITSPTNTFVKYLERKTKRPIEILPEPIDEVFFSTRITQEPKNDQLRFVTVSRLSPEKNIDILIRAFAKSKTNCALTIIGEGTEKHNLLSLTKSLHAESKINFQGWVHNQKLPNEFLKHNVFISASDFETFGMTTIEALACKLPCLLFDYPTSREILPKDTGILINSKDPAVWTDTIDRLEKDRNLLSEFKSKLDRIYIDVRKNSELETSKRLIDIYKSI